MPSLSKFLTLLALIGTQVTTAPIPSEITVEAIPDGAILGKCFRDSWPMVYDDYTVFGMNWPIDEAELKYLLQGKPDPGHTPRLIRNWKFEEENDEGIQVFRLTFRMQPAMQTTVAQILNKIKPLDIRCDLWPS